MALLENYSLLHQALKMVGLTVFHTLWSGCLVLLLFIVVLKIIPVPRAKVRFAISWTVLQLLLLLFVGIFFQQWKETAIATKPLAPSGNVTSALGLPSETLISTGSPAAEPITSPAQTIHWRTVLHQWAPVGAVLWLLGCLFHLVRLGGGLWHTQQFRVHSQPLSNDWEGRLNSLKQYLGVGRKVAFLSSHQTLVPFTFGWLRPVVLIPTSLLTQLSPEQIEMIVLHELAHIRRHDYLWSLGQSVAEIVLFYHPAYWYIARVLEREREFACDQMTVDVTQQPETYARTLLDIASTKATAFGLAASNRRDLSARIKRIVAPTYHRQNVQLAPALILVGLLGFASVTFALQRQPSVPSNANKIDSQLHPKASHDSLNAANQWLYIVNGQVQTSRPAFLDQDHMKGRWETYAISRTEEWIKPYLTVAQRRSLSDGTYDGILLVTNKKLLDKSLKWSNPWQSSSGQWLYIVNGKMQTNRPVFLDQYHQADGWKTRYVPITEHQIGDDLTERQRARVSSGQYTGILIITSEERELWISSSDQKPGVYFVQWTVGKQRVTRKVTIQ